MTNILCVTFTNKAAAEMKQRIRKLVGDKDLAYISTVHGFCVQFLKEEYKFLHYPQTFIVLDEEDKKQILRQLFDACNIDTKLHTIESTVDSIHRFKRDIRYLDWLINPNEEPLNTEINNSTDPIQTVILKYIKYERKCFGLDFDDLINASFYTMSNSSEIRDKWQRRMEYIMVDEFQDISDRQYQLLKLLSDYHKNLFVVGDPDQTIYEWRGASVHTMINFTKENGCKTIIMDANYRSLPFVINPSNALIKKNTARINKNIVPTRTKKGLCVYFHAKSQKEEADWISKQIMEFSSYNQPYSSIAILYRAHYVSRSIEESLISNHIPYKIWLFINTCG